MGIKDRFTMWAFDQKLFNRAGRWFLPLLGMVCMAAPLYAESPEALAGKVQSAYESTKDLSMDFVQDTYVEVLERKVEKKGKAQFQKPGKFAILYEGKKGREYRCDGKTLWVYRNGDKQVEVYAVNDERVPAEALSFLGGLGNLTRDFAVETVDEKKWEHLGAKKGDLNWLELTPLKKRSQIQWLVMGFDPKTHLAQEVYFLTDSNNLSHYRFKKVEPNRGIPADAFEFSKPGIKELR